MMKSIKTLCFIGATAFLTACGWHFDNGAAVPAELKTMALESSDPYSEISMAMRKQVLRLNKQTSSDKVASVFKQGREAEKVLTLDVEAAVRLANGETYPISAKINRTFFDNSRAALAKSAERDVIWNDMREQAARQLINKMAALQHQVQGK